MSRPPHIRLADARDAAAIESLVTRSWRASFAQIVTDAKPVTKPERSREDAWRLRLMRAAEGRRRFWIIEHDGSIAVVSETAPTRDLDDDEARTSELILIYVEPHLWGMGIGKTLLGHSIEDVRQRGWRELSLWVFERNVSARRFYENAGMRLDGGRKTVERAGAILAEVRYRRSLETGGGAIPG